MLNKFTFVSLEKRMCKVTMIMFTVMHEKMDAKSMLTLDTSH